MSDNSDLSRRRMGWMGWAAATIAVLLVAGGVTWAAINFRPAGSAALSTPTVAVTPTSTPTPQATKFTKPTPGATDPVAKPDDVVEVALDEPADSAHDTVIEVTSIESFTAGGGLPGETSGPAIKVAVRITNNGDAAIDTAGSNVNLTYGGDDQIPAVALTSDDTAVWSTSIAAGADGTAVYIFSVPESSDGDIRVIVDLLASAPDVVFVGPRP